MYTGSKLTNVRGPHKVTQQMNFRSVLYDNIEQYRWTTNHNITWPLPWADRLWHRDSAVYVTNMTHFTTYRAVAGTWPSVTVRRHGNIPSHCFQPCWRYSCRTLHRSQCTAEHSTEAQWTSHRHLDENNSPSDLQKVFCAIKTCKFSEKSYVPTVEGIVFVAARAWVIMS